MPYFVLYKPRGQPHGNPNKSGRSLLDTFKPIAMNYKEKLIKEVRKRSHISREAKESLISSKIQPKEIITESEYNTAIKNLSRVLIQTSLLLGKKEILLSKVVGLERHEYAPELNKLVLKDGTELSARGATTVEEAVAMNV